MTNINELLGKIIRNGYTAEVYETNAGQLILHVTNSGGNRWTLAGMEMQTGSLRDALDALAQGASPDAWDGYDHLDDDAWDTLDGGDVVLSTSDGVAPTDKMGAAARLELAMYDIA